METKDNEKGKPSKLRNEKMLEKNVLVTERGAEGLGSKLGKEGRGGKERDG